MQVEQHLTKCPGFRENTRIHVQLRPKDLRKITVLEDHYFEDFNDCNLSYKFVVVSKKSANEVSVK